MFQIQSSGSIRVARTWQRWRMMTCGQTQAAVETMLQSELHVASGRTERLWSRAEEGLLETLKPASWLGNTFHVEFAQRMFFFSVFFFFFKLLLLFWCCYSGERHLDSSKAPAVDIAKIKGLTQKNNKQWQLKVTKMKNSPVLFMF